MGQLNLFQEATEPTAKPSKPASVPRTISRVPYPPPPGDYEIVRDPELDGHYFIVTPVEYNGIGVSIHNDWWQCSDSPYRVYNYNLISDDGRYVEEFQDV